MKLQWNVSTKTKEKANHSSAIKEEFLKSCNSRERYMETVSILFILFRRLQIPHI